MIKGYLLFGSSRIPMTQTMLNDAGVSSIEEWNAKAKENSKECEVLNMIRPPENTIQSEARKRLTHLIEHAKIELAELDARGEKLEPFVSHVWLCLEEVRDKGYEPVFIALPERVRSKVRDVLGIPLTELLGLPIKTLSPFHVDCFCIIVKSETNSEHEDSFVFGLTSGDFNG